MLPENCNFLFGLRISVEYDKHLVWQLLTECYMNIVHWVFQWTKGNGYIYILSICLKKDTLCDTNRTRCHFQDTEIV